MGGREGGREGGNREVRRDREMDGRMVGLKERASEGRRDGGKGFAGWRGSMRSRVDRWVGEFG